MNLENEENLSGSEPEGKGKEHRERFLWLDPLAISKRLLYQKDGRHFIGLILHTDFDPATKRFKVSQAMPAKLRKQGVKQPIVGTWHPLKRKWEKPPP
jgi:hypothetical protein